MELYKIVGPLGEPLNGGKGLWPLPVGDKPGAWREVPGEVVPCHNGLHLTDAAHLETWLPREGTPCVVYRVETRGELIDAGDKYAARAVRLLPRTRPMPNLGEARRRQDAAIDAGSAPIYAAAAVAADKYKRVIAKADTARARMVPKGLVAYAAAVRGTGKVPAVGMFTRLAEAEAEYNRIAGPAIRRWKREEARYNAELRAVRDAANAAYAAEVAGILP